MEKAAHILLLAAAAVMAATLVAHVFLGGPEINSVVQMSNLPAEVRATSAVVWHMITALIAFFVIATLTLIKRPNPALALSLVGLEAAFALIFVGMSLYAFANPLTLPQWTAFALAAALTVPALNRSKP